MRRLCGRIVTKIAVRHAQELFPVVLLACFRDHPLIDEQVVHDPQAGRSLIADPTDLNRRRLTCKDQQAILRGVAGKVEKDVDLVRPDLGRQPFVAHAKRVVPVGGGGPKAICQTVFDDPIGITDRLMPFLAEVLQDADQKESHRMLPQIGRDKAQTKAISGIDHSLIVRQRPVQGCRVQAVVLDVGLGQGRGRDIRTIVKRVEQVTVRLGVAWLFCQRPAIARQRFVKAPLVSHALPRLFHASA